MQEQEFKKKKIRKKFEAEIGAEPKIVAEDVAIRDKKKYTSTELVRAITDVSLYIDNAYFRTPFKRCPKCFDSSTIMAHFGIKGKNTIGNLRGFSATIGDVIAWSSRTYKGLSIVKSKLNGIYELETECFDKELKEPAIVELMLVPSKLKPVIEEMATYLANKDLYEGVELVKIGDEEYPNAFREKL